MFAEGAREYLRREAELLTTGDLLTDLRAGVEFFVGFCEEDPARHQLLFQRTIPGFEPTPETFALSIQGLEAMKARLARFGVTDERAVDLLTAIGTGITDQQISNDPGGDRWIGLIDEAMAMFAARVTGSGRPRRAGLRATQEAHMTMTVTPVDDIPALGRAETLAGHHRERADARPGADARRRRLVEGHRVHGLGCAGLHRPRRRRHGGVLVRRPARPPHAGGEQGERAAARSSTTA